MTQQKLSREQVIAIERKLAKFAKLMDGVIRIPFTKRGFGIDALLSTVPIAGDIAGLLLTLYAFRQARKVGVSYSDLMPAIRLAGLDFLLGSVPVVGTIMDIFFQPSRKTLDIVRAHISKHYAVEDDSHIERPFLHSALERRQKKSSFWRNNFVSWFWMRLPDFIGLTVILLMLWLAYTLFNAFISFFSWQ